MKIKRISILGCGYIGLPLAKVLVKKKFKVNGSTTTPEKLKWLTNSGVSAYLIHIPEQEIEFDTPKNKRDLKGEQFWAADVLIITLPFRRSLRDPASYYQQMNYILSCLTRSSIKKVILTSSTSIYPNLNSVVTEESCFVPADPRSTVLMTVEKLFQQNKSFQTTILRLAGLYGGSREIGRFLSGKTDLPDSKAPVNLVHQLDVVRVIVEVILKKAWGEVFNVCSDIHPAKQDLYSIASLKRGLSVPTFKDDPHFSYKIVSNEKLKKYLHFSFEYPNPLG